MVLQSCLSTKQDCNNHSVLQSSHIGGKCRIRYYSYLYTGNAAIAEATHSENAAAYSVSSRCHMQCNIAAELVWPHPGWPVFVLQTRVKRLQGSDHVQTCLMPLCAKQIPQQASGFLDVYPCSCNKHDSFTG